MGMFYEGELISLIEVAKRWNCSWDTVVSTINEIAQEYNYNGNEFSFFNVSSKRQANDLSIKYEISECVYDSIGDSWIECATQRAIHFQNIYVKKECLTKSEEYRNYLVDGVQLPIIRNTSTDDENQKIDEKDIIIKNLTEELHQKQIRNRELIEQVENFRKEIERLNIELRLKEPKPSNIAQNWEKSASEIVKVIIDILTQEKKKWYKKEFEDKCYTQYSHCHTKAVANAWSELPIDYKHRDGRPKKP